MSLSTLCRLLPLLTVSLLSLSLYSLSLAQPPIRASSESEAVRALSLKYKARQPPSEGVEVRLWDHTRVDLVNDEYAIEVDWASKWAEAIGQSLYYAELTGKRPGIILLTEDPVEEARFIYRCQTVCAKHRIRLWVEKVIKE